MNTTTKFPILLLASLLALTACSKKEEEPKLTESDVEAAAQKAAAEAQSESEKKLGDQLASGLASIKKDSDDKLAAAKAEMESKLETEKAKLQEEMAAKLADETAALKSQFVAQSATLREQYESLKSKYDSIKDKLPEDVVSSVAAKLPQLSSSVSTLEGLASKFNPSSLEQLKELQTKYESEIAIAKKVADEVLKLLGKGSVSDLMPKL